MEFCELGTTGKRIDTRYLRYLQCSPEELDLLHTQKAQVMKRVRQEAKKRERPIQFSIRGLIATTIGAALICAIYREPLTEWLEKTIGIEKKPAATAGSHQ